MKESYESGSATHIGPESCGAAREGGVEALTGGSSRQGCESGWVKVPAPSIACIRTASISGACRGNEARYARM
jgi:hypothetical protein